VTAVELALALAVAAVSMNEAGGHGADVALIYQVAEGHGETAAERLRWLRRHSSCVLTDRPMSARERAGNCAWTRHLADTDAEPQGWPETASWERWGLPRWRRARRLARALVSGEDRRRPCDRTPDTWGGAMDAERALAAGMRPVVCRGPRNRGWLYPRRRSPLMEGRYGHPARKATWVGWLSESPVPGHLRVEGARLRSWTGGRVDGCGGGFGRGDGSGSGDGSGFGCGEEWVSWS
jgi:hypothetical protein